MSGDLQPEPTTDQQSPDSLVGTGAVPRDHRRGILYAGLGVLLLTPDSLLIRLVQAETTTLLFWRALFQCIALFLALTIRSRGRVVARVREMGRAGWAVAVLMACGNALFISSIRLTTVANTLLIVSAAPLLGAIFTRIFLREAVPSRTWIAAVSALIGVGIVFSGSIGAEGAHRLGDFFAFIVAIISGATFVLIRSVRGRSVAPAVGLAGAFIALGVLPWIEVFRLSIPDLLWISLLGIVIMPISFGLITQAPRYIPAPEVSLLMLTETILGPLWVWMVFAEVPAQATFVGGALLLGTVALHSALALRDALLGQG